MNSATWRVNPSTFGNSARLGLGVAAAWGKAWLPRTLEAAAAGRISFLRLRLMGRLRFCHGLPPLATAYGPSRERHRGQFRTRRGNEVRLWRWGGPARPPPCRPALGSRPFARA